MKKIERTIRIARQVACSHEPVDRHTDELGTTITEKICDKCGKSLEKTVRCERCFGIGTLDLCNKLDGFSKETCYKCNGTGKTDYKEFIKAPLPPLPA